MKHFSPAVRRNRGRPLKRLLDTWDRNGSTSGPTPWQIWWWWWWLWWRRRQGRGGGGCLNTPLKCVF